MPTLREIEEKTGLWAVDVGEKDLVGRRLHCYEMDHESDKPGHEYSIWLDRDERTVAAYLHVICPRAYNFAITNAPTALTEEIREHNERCYFFLLWLVPDAYQQLKHNRDIEWRAGTPDTSALTRKQCADLSCRGFRIYVERTVTYDNAAAWNIGADQVLASMEIFVRGRGW